MLYIKTILVTMLPIVSVCERCDKVRKSLKFNQIVLCATIDWNDCTFDLDIGATSHNTVYFICSFA